jgi:cell division protease FtsH
MVTRWGMSERLGAVMLGGGDELDAASRPACSEELAAQVDEEIRTIVRESQELARRVLQASRARMDAVVARLAEVETLRAADLDALLAEVEASSEQPAAG